jgi:hypothetical protein
MSEQAISATLDSDNLTWLRARAGAMSVRSVSELLDQLVTAARQGGAAGLARSVAGTIEIDARDPGLDHADAAIRGQFDASVRRPLVAREPRVNLHWTGRPQEDAAWLSRRRR